MAQRLSAMRKLQVDPHNVVALKQMYQSNQMVYYFLSFIQVLHTFNSIKALNIWLSANILKYLFKITFS